MLTVYLSRRGKYDITFRMGKTYDVIIIGAGAAGMMCAQEAGKRGRSVWLLDHASKIGEKIRISGGGRCNFTNLHAGPDAYVSANPHFCKSALKQFTQQDFIALIEKHGVSYHEKKLGQLFCDGNARQVVDLLLQECKDAGVRISPETMVEAVEVATDGGYIVETSRGKAHCQSLVIATGGLSIPKIGSSKFGYDVARQFGLSVVETRPALVPLTFSDALLSWCKDLSGLSVEANVACGATSFAEALLFTHRGLSGPAILQISSYWREGEELLIDLAPGTDVLALLKARKKSHPKQEVHTALSHILPARLAEGICTAQNIKGRLADLPDKALAVLAQAVNAWRIKPAGTEGYRTAEVTHGGIDTAELSSQTMEARRQPGLYFIGEVVDVTGHLGGYNFQWAWSSGYAAGQNV